MSPFAAQHRTESDHLLARAVVNSQPGDSRKLGGVAGDHGQPARERGARDEQVIRADRRARRGERRAQARGSFGRRAVERKDREAGQKPLGAGESADHGTWVASLLAGRGTGPDSGILGAAPQASILTASVALGTSIGSVSSDDQVAEAVRWAVDNGASVINMSLTRNTLDWPTSWDDAFQYAFSHDVVVVAAAGNRGSGTTEVGAPATIPGVLTVAGVDRAGKASFDASSQGITIGVSAPSEQLVGANPGGGYVQWAGTSGAAPLVSGAVALVRAAHPELKAPDVINRIIKTARPAGGTVPSPVYGYGLLEAAAAVTATVPHVTANPMGDLTQWIHIHRRADAPATAAPGDGNAQAAPAPKKLTPERPVTWKAFLWPQWSVLTTLWLPFSLISGFVALLALGGVGAWLHFRRAARRG